MAGQGIVGVRDVRELTALFDRDRFGLNVQVGVWYFVAQVITTFSWMIVPLVQGYDIGWNPVAYYVALTGVNALEAAAFVLVLHRVRELWPLAAAWGGVAMVMGAAIRLVIRVASIEGMSTGPVLDPMMLGSSFAFGALFIVGMALAVRRWGVLPWSFIGGASAASALQSVVFQLAWVLRQVGTGAAASVLLPAAIGGSISGAIVGGLVYVGIARHMNGRALAGAGLPGSPLASAAVPAQSAATTSPVSPSPVPPTAAVEANAAAQSAPPPPSGRQHFFVCSANPSLIATFMEVYGVARAAGWGEYRKLTASVFGGAFQRAQEGAARVGTPFPGQEHMGEQSEAATGLEEVLRQIRAAEASGTVHVAYGATSPLHAEWMRSTYRTLIGEAAKQGILPFRMYVTESDVAAAALLAALEEA